MYLNTKVGSLAKCCIKLTIKYCQRTTLENQVIIYLQLFAALACLILTF